MEPVPLIMQRDLLLVPFPFSNQSGNKVRPVTVISNEDFNGHSEDILVAGITSNISRGKYTLSLLNADLEEGKLYSKCCIKAENILKIEKTLVVKKIGKIKKAKLESLITTINQIISAQ